MTKVVVNIKELSNFSQKLTTDATEFDQITKKMGEIINSLASGWQGYDAENFISNATSYLENLNVVKKAIIDSASSTQKNVVAYTNRINEFYEKLGG